MSQRNNPESIFHRISILPVELQSKIWQLAVPDPDDIQLRINGQNGWISGITSFSTAMLGACRLSRREILSIYEPILLTRDLGCLYMIRGDREPDPNKHSRVNLMDYALGYREMESQEGIDLELFLNWPPNKDEERIYVNFARGNSKLWDSRCQKFVPRRLWSRFGIGRSRRIV